MLGRSVLIKVGMAPVIRNRDPDARCRILGRFTGLMFRGRLKPLLDECIALMSSVDLRGPLKPFFSRRRAASKNNVAFSLTKGHGDIGIEPVH